MKNTAKVKALLARRVANNKRADRLRLANNKRIEALRKRLDAEAKPELDGIAVSEASIVSGLQALNPYQVGTHIQSKSVDGLLGGPVYQVTRVVDHETLFARPITARGKLGVHAERFAFKAAKYQFNTHALENCQQVLAPAKKKGAR